MSLKMMRDLLTVAREAGNSVKTFEEFVKFTKTHREIIAEKGAKDEI